MSKDDDDLRKLFGDSIDYLPSEDRHYTDFPFGGTEEMMTSGTWASPDDVRAAGRYILPADRLTLDEMFAESELPIPDNFIFENDLPNIFDAPIVQQVLQAEGRCVSIPLVRGADYILNEARFLKILDYWPHGKLKNVVIARKAL